LSEQALWDIVEMEAIEKYYLWKDSEQKFAEKPAITLNTGFTSVGKERYTLYFGNGLGHWGFTSVPKAHLKVGEILKGKKAKVVDRKGKVRVVQYKNKEGKEQ
jgi:hypothetical protein